MIQNACRVLVAPSQRTSSRRENDATILDHALDRFDVADFDAADTIPNVAAILLRPFFSDSALRDDLEQILAETFSFPIPLKKDRKLKTAVLTASLVLIALNLIAAAFVFSAVKSRPQKLC